MLNTSRVATLEDNAFEACAAHRGAGVFAGTHPPAPKGS